MTEKNFNTALLCGSVCYAVNFRSVAKPLCATVKFKQWNQETMIQSRLGETLVCL